MTQNQKRTKEVENVRTYLYGVAKNLADKLYGPLGPVWGTKLTEIENLCLDVREVLSETLLKLSLERQASAHDQQDQPALNSCPGCQQKLDWDTEQTQKRMLQTAVGETVWSEPEGYCPRCRRAFFPSVAQLGN